jgi:hypothetical protein
MKSWAHGNFSLRKNFDEGKCRLRNDYPFIPRVFRSLSPALFPSQYRSTAQPSSSHAAPTAIRTPAFDPEGQNNKP